MNSTSWEQTTWGEKTTLEYGKALIGYDPLNGDVPVYGTNGLIGYTEKPLCNFPSVIIGRKGAYRGVHFSKIPFYVIDTAFFLVPKKNDLDLRFAYYQLLTQDINSLDSGSAIPSTSRSDFYSLSLLLPPLEEQRAIAEVLSALDDKIELNRRMNQTLESLAQTIYKHMFIDNPERKGWKEGCLGDVAYNLRSGISPNEIHPDTPYIGLEHMPQKSISLSEWGISEDISSNKFLFKKGDILFGKLRPYFHKVGIAPIDGICSTDILVLSPMDIIHFGFLLEIVSSKDFIDRVNQASEGTKMPRTSWNFMSKYPISIPPSKLADEFSTITQPMFEKIISNIHESRTLAELRDTLLPKLMSGQVRVRAG